MTQATDAAPAVISAEGGCVAGLFGACLVLGGGTHAGFLNDTLLQFGAIPILALWAWRAPELALTPLRVAALAIGAAVLALPLLQLVPLPATVWGALPGREVFAEIDRAVSGRLGWRQITVSRDASWFAFLSLLPPLAIFIGVLFLGYRERRFLTLGLIGFGVVSVVVGFSQLAQGQASALYFYEITNRGDPVGFFANRNHFAALLYAVMPFAAAWAVSTTAAPSESRRGQGPASWLNRKTAVAAAGLFLFIFFFVALGMARSRAGMMLAVFGVLGILALGVAGRSKEPGNRAVTALMIASAVAFLLVLQFALYRILQRFDGPALMESHRTVINKLTLEAAAKYFPFGSGVGTFRPVYQMHETPEAAINTYVNRAHNDFFELWLEAGLFAVLIGVLFFGWLIYATYRLWFRNPDGVRPLDLNLARAASLAVWMLLIHSAVDYPLRTGGMIAVMAFSLGLMVDPAGLPSAPTRREARGSHNAQPRSRSSRSRRRPAQAAAAATPPSDEAFGWPESAPAEQPPGQGGLWGEDVDWPDAWKQPPGARRTRDDDGQTS